MIIEHGNMYRLSGEELLERCLRVKYAIGESR